MFNKKSALLSLAIISSAVSLPTYAQSENTAENDSWRLQPEFSIGAGYGLTKMKDDDFEEDEAAKKVFALVKFNEYIGVEAAYIDFDEASNNGASLDADGRALALLLEAPITEAVSIYAKGGQLWWDADASLDTSLGDLSDDYDGDETFWGAGVKFQLAENLDLRLEYERFNFEISRDEFDVLQADDIDMDVDFASANIQFTF
ncbi:MAG TPA: porin family protein [Cellvibrio sp.]|nr:porin family protein [Cellvibrio sp.]